MEHELQRPRSYEMGLLLAIYMVLYSSKLTWGIAGLARKMPCIGRGGSKEWREMQRSYAKVDGAKRSIPRSTGSIRSIVAQA